MESEGLLPGGRGSDAAFGVLPVRLRLCVLCEYAVFSNVLSHVLSPVNHALIGSSHSEAGVIAASDKEGARTVVGSLVLEECPQFIVTDELPQIKASQPDTDAAVRGTSECELDKSKPLPRWDGFRSLKDIFVNLSI